MRSIRRDPGGAASAASEDSLQAHQKLVKNMEFKKDKYRRARGGYSRLFKIYCAKCNTYLFNYQKDGPGIFKRLYLDRIDLQVSKKKSLICSKCKNLIGIPFIYTKENRPAIRLFVGTIIKKLTKA
ncbi:MAG TPA: hypothetical protein VL306_00045 [Methylomirabilota bacterium]|jgi:hypothetical protein|nr:hypothetical protein [Methylomirabilota bacterium]